MIIPLTLFTLLIAAEATFEVEWVDQNQQQPAYNYYNYQQQQPYYYNYGQYGDYVQQYYNYVNQWNANQNGGGSWQSNEPFYIRSVEWRPSGYGRHLGTIPQQTRPQFPINDFHSIFRPHSKTQPQTFTQNRNVHSNEVQIERVEVSTTRHPVPATRFIDTTTTYRPVDTTTTSRPVETTTTYRPVETTTWHSETTTTSKPVETTTWHTETSRIPSPTTRSIKFSHLGEITTKRIESTTSTQPSSTASTPSNEPKFISAQQVEVQPSLIQNEENDLPTIDVETISNANAEAILGTPEPTNDSGDILEPVLIGKVEMEKGDPQIASNSLSSTLSPPVRGFGENSVIHSASLRH